MNINTMTMRTSGRYSKQSGMTLVELMIAMVLGLVLLGGVLQVFSSSRQSYRVHEAISRMQESGRMALEVISRDVRMADFWGCASDTTSVTNNLDNGGTGYIDFGSGGIGGFDGGGTLPDTLLLRGGFNRGLGIEPPYGPQASANIKVPPGNGIEEEDILIVSDCSGADIFQVTNANPDGSGQLVHNTGTGSPGNFNVTNPGCPGANAHCFSRIYGADASVFEVRQITYTIGAGLAGQPALFRNGLEFLDGIENIQILYGEDTDAPGTAGFGTANYYVPESPGVDMASVISLRIAIVARSYDDGLTNGATQNYSLLGTNVAAPDNRLRQVYTSTVTVRNRL